jgi:hypothetical protein
MIRLGGRPSRPQQSFDTVRLLAAHRDYSFLPKPPCGSVRSTRQAEMKKYAYAIVIRLLLFIVPLYLLNLFALNAFEHARRQEHHGDTGLGIAIVLGLVSLTMLMGFFIDLIVQVKRKWPAGYLTDAAIVLTLLMPFGWFACNWYGLNENIACKLPLAGFGSFLEWMNL